MFAALLEDNAKYVCMETPEIFRVLGKRKPGYIAPYFERFQSLPEPDRNRVACVHAASAARAAEKAKQKGLKG